MKYRLLKEIRGYPSKMGDLIDMQDDTYIYVPVELVKSFRFDDYFETVAENENLYVMQFSVPQTLAISGNVIEYNPEYNEWNMSFGSLEVNIYGFRGNILEGEIAMLLNYARENNLTSLLKPYAETLKEVKQ